MLADLVNVFQWFGALTEADVNYWMFLGSLFRLWETKLTFELFTLTSENWLVICLIFVSDEEIMTKIILLRLDLSVQIQIFQSFLTSLMSYYASLIELVKFDYSFIFWFLDIEVTDRVSCKLSGSIDTIRSFDWFSAI